MSTDPDITPGTLGSCIAHLDYEEAIAAMDELLAMMQLEGNSEAWATASFRIANSYLIHDDTAATLGAAWLGFHRWLGASVRAHQDATEVIAAAERLLDTPRE